MLRVGSQVLGIDFVSPNGILPINHPGGPRHTVGPLNLVFEYFWEQIMSLVARSHKSVLHTLLRATASAGLLAVSLPATLAGCSSSDSGNGGNGGGGGADPGTGDKTGLQVYLKLDESSIGAGPKDTAGKVTATYGAVKPTVSVTAATVTFANPAALEFKGTETVEIPASDNLKWTGTESYSMSLWAFPKAMPPANNFAALLSNNPGGENGNYCGIYIHSAGTWSFESNGYFRPNPEVLSASPVVLNKWQHIVIVNNAMAGSQTIYVDGVPGSTVLARANANCESSATFSIGAKDGDGYVGLIDDVRIYGQALTEAQVKELKDGAENITP
ncbi:MAG: LamG domain-containing protein [Polyangiaceae bacterium]|nr:LamG domain-containing protein [Polyangiaceae bacterium]